MITEEEVAPFLAGRFGRPYLWHESCPSTQDALRGSSLPEGAVAVAEAQTAGRGRSGRRWETEPSAAILVSILLRPEVAVALPPLSLVAGLAVAEGIEAVTGVTAAIKWPNDVIVDDRKVAGILLEGERDAVICGIGINVNQKEESLPDRPELAAGSLLGVTGRVHDRAAILGAVLNALEGRYDAFRARGVDHLVPLLETRNWLNGKRVRTARGAGIAGELVADGRIAVIGDDGALELVASGELTLIQPS